MYIDARFRFDQSALTALLKSQDRSSRWKWKGDIPVYPPNKSIRRQESHRTSQKAIDCAGQKTVAEEKQTRHKAGYV